MFMRAHHHTHDENHDGQAEAALAELLDLDAEVLNSYWSDVLSLVERVATPTSGSRIVDLGAGTGTAAIALAQRFAGAEVIAVDSSAEMLRRVRAKALALGLADRIHTVHADLNSVWPVLDPIDVTWASMSLHHLADPDRVLRDLYAATRPGGRVAVAEFSEPLRFLPQDLGFGRPGLEQRCLDALTQEHAHSLPELGSDWSSRLQAAGFTIVGEHTFIIELNPPHPPSATRYAEKWLLRLTSGLTHQLAHDDRETLATLIDSEGAQSLHRRDDLQIRGSRTVTLARRQH